MLGFSEPCFPHLEIRENNLPSTSLVSGEGGKAHGLPVPHQAHSGFSEMMAKENTFFQEPVIRRQSFSNFK